MASTVSSEIACAFQISLNLNFTFFLVIQERWREKTAGNIDDEKVPNNKIKLNAAHTSPVCVCAVWAKFHARIYFILFFCCCFVALLSVQTFIFLHKFVAWMCELGRRFGGIKQHQPLTPSIEMKNEQQQQQQQRKKRTVCMRSDM